MADVAAPPGPKSLACFLEDVPPGVMEAVEFGPRTNYNFNGRFEAKLDVPLLKLHCTDSSCNRVMFFASTKKELLLTVGRHDEVLYFTCRHCARVMKSFSLRFAVTDKSCTAFKFGEVPPFGPPLPARLLRLAGNHGELLKKGRRSENQGLGIGAFAYYRRVVELQKGRLIDELSNAVTRLGGDTEALQGLERARTENQFSNAIEIMAGVTPKELFVSGQNPLTLLHAPLSVGLHGLSDDECLKNAHNVRIVLAALLERIAAVTEEKAELDAAVKELLGPRSQPAQKD